MKESFADIVDYRFTANMEDKLDSIESGDTTTEKVLAEFWTGFSRELEAANEAGGEHLALPLEETDMVCEKCGAKMVIRNGRFGKFAACPNYPKCRNTKPLESEKKNDKKEVEEEKVDAAIEMIKEHSSVRTHNLPVRVSFGVGTHEESPTEVLSGGAAVFVTDVERFEKV